MPITITAQLCNRKAAQYFFTHSSTNPIILAHPLNSRYPLSFARAALHHSRPARRSWLQPPATWLSSTTSPSSCKNQHQLPQHFFFDTLALCTVREPLHTNNTNNKLTSFLAGKSNMSSEMNMFKHIPCPKGDDCNAFRCLFRHKWDDETWPLPAAGPSPLSIPSLDGASDQQGPRKRLKVTDEDGSSAASPVETSATATDELKRKVPVSKTSRPSVEAGPPAKPETSASSTPDASATKDEISAKKPEAATKKAIPRKPESLNPRHLTRAPLPHSARLKLVQLLHEQHKRLNDELKQIVAKEESNLVYNDQELIWRTLDEEIHYATKKYEVYSNVLKNRIVALKKMAVSQWKKERQDQRAKEATKAKPDTATATPVDLESGLPLQQQVLLLKELQTPITGLEIHGYVSQVPSEEEARKAREGEKASQGWEQCDRCQTRFQVFPGRREEDGALTSGGKCVHHPGRRYVPPKPPGDNSFLAKRYTCCSQTEGDSQGCATADNHVYKFTSASRLAGHWNFAETPENPSVPTDRVVCFDCEMCYTVRGMEVIRVSATSWPDGAELLDILVKPKGEILDLNSTYSGVWPQDMTNATVYSPDTKAPAAAEGARKILAMVPSPEAARDALFSFISPTTPLIGHGLENDLNTLRIVHPYLIDTILLFPHSKGLPLRMSLKVLTDRILGRRIQLKTDGQLAGHDSGEDARAAGDLVRFKLKKLWQSKQSNGYTLIDGKIVAPPPKLPPAGSPVP